MTTSTQTATAPFKPFLVQGDHQQRSIFKVTELDEVTREQAEILLQNLPMRFSIRKGDADDFVEVNEPLDVDVDGSIIRIYPPKYCYLSCVSFQSWEFNSITSQMMVDNIMDDWEGGQQRSCVHLQPSILGVEDWPTTDRAVEIDIFKYPQGTKRPHNITGRTYTASELLPLIEAITGEREGSLSLEQFKKFKNIIMMAVEDHRICYENQPEDYEVRKYYQPFWSRIDKAKNNDEVSLKVISELAIAIRYQ